VSAVALPFFIKVNATVPAVLADDTVADRLLKVPATVTFCVQAEMFVLRVHGPTTELYIVPAANLMVFVAVAVPMLPSMPTDTPAGPIGPAAVTVDPLGIEVPEFAFPE
jgi:hypothetical protein